MSRKLYIWERNIVCQTLISQNQKKEKFWQPTLFFWGKNHLEKPIPPNRLNLILNVRLVEKVITGSPCNSRFCNHQFLKSAEKWLFSLKIYLNYCPSRIILSQFYGTYKAKCWGPCHLRFSNSQIVISPKIC